VEKKQGLAKQGLAKQGFDERLKKKNLKWTQKSVRNNSKLKEKFKIQVKKPQNSGKVVKTWEIKLKTL